MKLIYYLKFISMLSPTRLPGIANESQRTKQWHEEAKRGEKMKFNSRLKTIN
jgi:hypothetical protein